MQNLKDFDLAPFELETERTLRQRRREQKNKQNIEHEVIMAEAQIQLSQPVMIDEDEMLVGEFMTPSIIQNQSNIAYPPYGQPNFQLRPNVINLFQNNLQFYGKSNENSHGHVSRFLELCSNFSYQGVNNGAIRMRLFPHTLRDEAREWLDSNPASSITSWNDLIQKFTTKYFPPAKVAQ